MEDMFGQETSFSPHRQTYRLSSFEITCQSTGSRLLRAMSKLRNLLFLLGVLGPLPVPAEDGKTLFTQHCAACHLPDRQLVGPSLVEVSKLYRGKLPEFLAWCKEPKQKRKGVIQMPPMGHVGDGDLELIHAYILSASKGLKEVKVRGIDPFYASPSMRKRPQVQRIFMPEAGPAAIAVAVNDDFHYCWDAGECRLRYLWKGDFIDGWAVWRANGHALAKIQGEVLLREGANPINLIDEIGSGPQRQPKFHGYRLRDGLPTFRWSLQGVEVTESIRPTENGKALRRSFSFKGLSAPLSLQFASTDQLTITPLRISTDKDGRCAVTLTPKN